MIRRHPVWSAVLAGLVLLAIAGYTQRLQVLRYSLGWYTDLRYPRDANRPVPWQAGPASAERSACVA